MLEFSYTEAHQTLLKAYLSQSEQAMPYALCEGYLFATICSPAGIEAEQWLSAVSGGDELIAEEQVFALMALHHDISEHVFNGSFQLSYGIAEYDSLQQWSQGFLLGIEHFYAGLANAEPLTDELRQALVAATEKLGFFSLEQTQIKQFCEANNLELENFCAEQHTIANEFAPAYVQIIENAAVASGLYNEEID